MKITNYTVMKYIMSTKICPDSTEICCKIKELKNQIRLYGTHLLIEKKEEKEDLTPKVIPDNLLTIVKEISNRTLVYGILYTWTITITVENHSSNTINNITITDIIDNNNGFIYILNTVPSTTSTSTFTKAVTTFNLNANSQYIFKIVINENLSNFDNALQVPNFATLSLLGYLPKNSNTVFIDTYQIT
jgi:hypothetical protein